MVFFLGLACIAGGFFAVLPLFSDRYPRLGKFDKNVKPYKIIIGLAILIIGVLTFFIPYHRSGRIPLVPIFGDLIPSVLGMLLGVLISIDFLESLKGFKGKFSGRLKEMLHKYQYPIGFAGIVFGILHWFLFRWPFF